MARKTCLPPHRQTMQERECKHIKIPASSVSKSINVYMKNLNCLLFLTKSTPKSTRNHLLFNILPQQARPGYVPPPTLLRYKSDSSPIIHGRIGSEVDRRKYGQDDSLWNGCFCKYSFFALTFRRRVLQSHGKCVPLHPNFK